MSSINTLPFFFLSFFLLLPLPTDSARYNRNPEELALSDYLWNLKSVWIWNLAVSFRRAEHMVIPSCKHVYEEQLCSFSTKKGEDFLEYYYTLFSLTFLFYIVLETDTLFFCLINSLKPLPISQIHESGGALHKTWFVSCRLAAGCGPDDWEPNCSVTCCYRHRNSCQTAKTK